MDFSIYRHHEGQVAWYKMSQLGKTPVQDGIAQAKEAHDCSETAESNKSSPVQLFSSPRVHPATSPDAEVVRRSPQDDVQPILLDRFKGLVRFMQRIGMCSIFSLG